MAKKLNIKKTKTTKPADKEIVDTKPHFSRTASQSSINKSEASRTKSSNIKKQYSE